jgi:hypothetical protein
MRVLFAVSCAVASVVVAPIAAGAASNTSGNGEVSKLPDTIFQDAVAATNATSAVRISGTVVNGSEHVTINIVSGHGSGGGTIAVNGEKFAIVVSPPNVYLKANAKTWTKVAHTALAGQLFADKWLQTTSDDPDFGTFAQLVDIGALTQSLSSNTDITKGKTTTFHGKPAIPLHSGTESSTLYVAATGDPFILGLAGTGKNQGELHFTGYGSAKLPKVPSHAINLDQLEQLGNGTSTTTGG